MKIFSSKHILYFFLILVFTTYKIFSFTKVSYIQMDATGSLSKITPGGYAASNILVFAFANQATNTVNSGYLDAMKKAMNSESQGTINLLSIGGEFSIPGDFIDFNKVVDNITTQINSYNNQLGQKFITGVDLDLEGDFSSELIDELAKGFKSNGLLVSIAPQVFTNSSSVNPINPTNLILTSGGAQAYQNNYGKAIVNGNVDYIFAQTYNTGGWTVGGYSENSPIFFTAISQALGNTVRFDCNSSSTNILCIPQNVKIIIGLPSNAGASGTANNIFNSNGQTKYNQLKVLDKINNQIKNILTYPGIDGVMQWSLNNDYMPNGWGDNFSIIGGFSKKIFGATS